MGRDGRPPSLSSVSFPPLELLLVQEDSIVVCRPSSRGKERRAQAVRREKEKRVLSFFFFSSPPPYSRNRVLSAPRGGGSSGHKGRGAVGLSISCAPRRYNNIHRGLYLCKSTIHRPTLERRRIKYREWGEKVSARNTASEEDVRLKMKEGRRRRDLYHD